MKLQVFDVVKLTNGNKATILDIDKNKYKVEIVDKSGKTKEVKDIEEVEIKEVIISK